jgi:hypothetical protein
MMELHFPVVLTLQDKTTSTMDRNLGGPQTRYGCGHDKKNSCTTQGHPVHSHFTDWAIPAKNHPT